MRNTCNERESMAGSTIAVAFGGLNLCIVLPATSFKRHYRFMTSQLYTCLTHDVMTF